MDSMVHLLDSVAIELVMKDFAVALSWLMMLSDASCSTTIGVRRWVFVAYCCRSLIVSWFANRYNYDDILMLWCFWLWICIEEYDSQVRICNHEIEKNRDFSAVSLFQLFLQLFHWSQQITAISGRGLKRLGNPEDVPSVKKYVVKMEKKWWPFGHHHATGISVCVWWSSCPCIRIYNSWIFFVYTSCRSWLFIYVYTFIRTMFHPIIKWDGSSQLDNIFQTAKKQI